MGRKVSFVSFSFEDMELALILPLQWSDRENPDSTNVESGFFYVPKKHRMR